MPQVDGDRGTRRP